MSKKAILVIVLLAASLAGTAALAGVNVDVNIGVPLPRVVVAAPPELAVIPGTYVYIATDVNADLMFYQNNWYRPHNGGWFVSLSYNGPWRAVAAPPAALKRLPRNYHNLPPGHERMPYGQVKNNWRSWERDRHWDQARAQDRREDHGNGHHKKYKNKKHHDDDYYDHDNGRGRGRHDR